MLKSINFISDDRRRVEDCVQQVIQRSYYLDNLEVLEICISNMILTRPLNCGKITIMHNKALHLSSIRKNYFEDCIVLKNSRPVGPG